MGLYEKIISGEEKLSLIGLGYVGMPIAVAHKEFRALTMDDFKKMFKQNTDTGRVLIDVKGLYPIKDMEAAGMTWWRL